MQTKEPSALLNLLKRADAFRRPERLAQLLEAASQAMPGFDRTPLERSLRAAAAVDAEPIARRASAPAAISALVDQAREQAISEALNRGG